MTASSADDRQVWYASYGSNMSSARLRCYLEGGAPQGSARGAPGARDHRMPEQAQAVQLPGAMYFAESSQRWGGGGVGFYDPDLPGPTLGRAYLLTDEQFADVLAQENGLGPGVDLDLSAAFNAGRLVLHDGWYGLVLRLADLAGRPTFTVTSARRRGPVNAPGRRYLQHVVQGLLEGHGLDADGVAAYLSTLAGVGTRWDKPSLRALAAEVAAHGPVLQ